MGNPTDCFGSFLYGRVCVKMPLKQNHCAHFETYFLLLRREKSFCKIFHEVFRSFCEVSQSFRKFFEVFASFSRLSDPFGPIGMHWDAFGSNWKRLDVFEDFEIFWIFESFFNVSGRNFYKRLFSRHNMSHKG